MSLMGSIQGLFSGSQNTNKVEDTTAHQASTGATSTTGATTGSIDPRYGYQIGNTFGQIPALYNPGRDLIQQSAAPVTANDINALRDPTAAAQIGAVFDPNGALLRSQADQRSYLNGSFTDPRASSNLKQRQDFELRSQAANNATAAGIVGQAWAPAAGTATANQQRVQTAGTGLTGAAAQQIGGVPILVQAGGQTTTGTSNVAGTSTGTVDSTGHNVSDSTTTNTPSAASTLGTVASIAADVAPFLLSDERVKKNIKEVGKTHDGQPIYKYEYLPGFGDPGTHMGLLAHETHPHAVAEDRHGLKHVDYDAATKGAERKADGGSVGHSFHDRVRDAYKVFSELKNGGAAPRYDDGGGVPFGEWGSPSPTGSENPVVGDGGWGATVDRELAAPTMGFGDRVRGILGAVGKMGASSAPSSVASQPSRSAPADDRTRELGLPRNSALEALQGAMAATGQALQPRGAADGGRQEFADGGSEDSWLGNLVKGLAPNSPFAAPDSAPARTLRDEYGVDPRAMYSPSRNLVRTLSSINPMVPGGPATLTGIPQRMAEEDAAAFKGAERLGQHAQLTGKTTTGADTMATKQMNQAAQIAAGSVPINGKMTPTVAARALEPHTEEAQIRIKAVEQANAAYQQRIQAIDDMELVDNSKGANAGVYQQMRDSARIAHEANLARLKPGHPTGGMPAAAGARQWTPEGGLQ